MTKCKQCKKTFTSAKKVYEHVYDSHTQSNTAQCCYQCCEYFKNPTSFKRHITLKHETINDPTFDVTNIQLHYPSWKQIKDNGNKNYNYILAGYLKMLNHSKIIKYQNLKQMDWNINIKKILADWKEHMGLQIDLKVCAVCGRELIMSKNEHHLFDYSNSLLQFTKANREFIKKIHSNETLNKALHHVSLEGETYRLSEKGVIHEKKKVIVCNDCNVNLINTRISGKLPKNIFAFYDVGRIPAYLPELTFAENLSITKIMTRVPILQLKPVFGHSSTACKGHCISVKYMEDNIIQKLSDAIKKRLPRDDLADIIKLNLCAVNSMIPTIKDIYRKSNLQIKIKNIMPWLKWLKEVNPQYKNVIIPKDEIEEKKAQDMLNDSVEEICKTAHCVASAKINSLMSHVRAEIEDELHGLNENIENEACVIRDSYITNENIENEPMDAVMDQINDTIHASKTLNEKKNVGKFTKTVTSDVFCEYTSNHQILNGAFPCLYPMPLTADVMGTANVPSILQKTWMLFYDKRFSRDVNLLFLLFDQFKRFKNNKAVYYRVKQSGDKEKQFVDLVNHDEFESKLQNAISEPQSSSAKQFKKKIEPLVSLIGRTTPYSVFERKDILAQIYSLTHSFGLPTHFLTISTNQRDNILTIRLALTEIERNKHTNKNNKKFALPNMTFRTRTIIKNPAIATYMIYRVIEKFFELIVQLPLNTFNGKQMQYSFLILQEFSKECGAYGPVRAHIGVFEEQKSGNLHYHCLLFGSWCIKMLHQFCHDPSIRKKLQDLIDSHITCLIPKIQENDSLITERKQIIEKFMYKDFIKELQYDYECRNQKSLIVSLKDPIKIIIEYCKPALVDLEYLPREVNPIELEILKRENPNDVKLKEKKKLNIIEVMKIDAYNSAAFRNHHLHIPECFPKEYSKCRRSYKQPLALQTHITQIEADEKDEPKVKYPYEKIDDMKIDPPPSFGDNIFTNIDSRILVSRLARPNYWNQMQVPMNIITQALLRCNTSTNVLFTHSCAKSAAFYIAKYISKNPFKISKLIPIIEQARKKLEKYGSTADDAGTNKRKALNILQQVLNKCGMEVSSQQAAAAILDYPSYFCSHEFIFITPWQFYHKYHENIYKITDENVETLTELAFDHKNRIAKTISNVEQYTSRGKLLQKFCVYMYNMFFHSTKLKNQKSKYKVQNNFTEGVKIIDSMDVDEEINENTNAINTQNNVDGKKSKAGHPPNPRFAFEPNSKAATCLEQTIRLSPKILRVSGDPPPEYPGNPPQLDAERSKQSLRLLQQWREEAQRFVEYYSLLFLPLDKNLCPISPYDDILPWNNRNSWTNFWKHFTKFRYSDNNYEFTVACIFENMVDNWRQKISDKTLISKWRNMTADTKTSLKNNSTKRNQNKNKQALEDYSNERELMEHLCEKLQYKNEKKFLTRKQTNIQDAKNYVESQVSKYEYLQQEVHCKKKKRKPYKQYSFDICKKAKKTSKGFISINSHDKNNKNAFAKDECEEISSEELEFWEFQTKMLLKLQSIRDNSKQTENTLEKQFLVFMNGPPGAGKTTIARKLVELLEMKAIFTGTTNTAAAELKAETINTVLGLGPNRSNYTDTTITNKIQKKIKNACADVNLLVIDEASMLTPVTLLRINNHLQLALNNKKLFGGLSVLLIGDMYQFPPVDEYLKKPALYQSVVMLALGKKLPHEAYTLGAILFTKFKMVRLKGQVRAHPEFDEWLSQIRNLDVDHPITDEWLDRLPILAIKDFKDQKINWYDSSIVVTTNVERHSFLFAKIKTYAKQNNEPILRWICPIKTGSKQYVIPEDIKAEDLQGFMDDVIVHFARGARCILTETLETKLGVAKGSEGIFLDAVWEDASDEPDWQNLESGKIYDVKQPDYIVIQIGKDKKKNNKIIEKKKIIAIKHKKGVDFKDYDHNDKKCQAHEVKLALSMTYHMIQGKNIKSLILSLNSTNTKGRRILPVSLNSVYVGCSRVHHFKFLRSLPLTDEDKEYLKSLQWDPYLRLFFNNYDENGNWKHDGLREQGDKEDDKIRVELAMADSLKDWTQKELQKFAGADNLDRLTSKNSKADMIEALQNDFIKGKKLLKQNNHDLYKQQQLIQYKKLQNKNINNMPTTTLRFYAKRVGIPLNNLTRKDFEVRYALRQFMLFRIDISQYIFDDELQNKINARWNQFQNEFSSFILFLKKNHKCKWEMLMNKYIKPLYKFHFGNVDVDRIIGICLKLLKENCNLLIATKTEISIRNNGNNNNYTEVYKNDEIFELLEQTHRSEVKSSKSSTRINKCNNTISINNTDNIKQIKNIDKEIDKEIDHMNVDWQACQCECHNPKLEICEEQCELCGHYDYD